MRCEVSGGKCLEQEEDKVRGVEQRMIRGEKRVAEAHDLGRMLQKCSEGRPPPTLFCRNRAHRGRGASPSLRRASPAAGSTPPARARSKRENGGENAGVTAVDGDECLGKSLG